MAGTRLFQFFSVPFSFGSYMHDDGRGPGERMRFRKYSLRRLAANGEESRNLRDHI